MEGSEAVLETLRQAASQDTTVLKPAEQRLKLWETEPGFYSVLMSIISNHSIDVHVRWLAVLYFKNGIDRYWRKTAPNAISEQEKIQLRKGLLANFQEPVNQVATQLSVLISKVARFDCPKEWPELVPLLLEAVQSSEELIGCRALLTLHHVTKALSSKRLAADRRLFMELTNNIFPFLLQLWIDHSDTFLQQFQCGGSGMSSCLDKAVLTLRVLRKLLVHGFKKPHEVTHAVAFIDQLFQRTNLMLQCWKTFQDQRQHNLWEACSKYLILLVKTLTDTLEYHPLPYVRWIRQSLEAGTTYGFSTGQCQPTRFTILWLNLIKGILLCSEYRPAKDIQETKEPLTLEAYQLKKNFFTGDALSILCQRLVTCYFPLTEEDLKLWASDPEEFAHEEGGESWKYSLRPCCESLFIALFREYRDGMAEVLLRMVRESPRLINPNDLQAVLQKDALYNAVGLTAFDLYDDVDFNDWFTNTLIHELKTTEGFSRVIRRRIAWLVGQWTGVALNSSLRPTLYSVLLPLIGSGEDMVVRLAAASSLKASVDDFEFDCQQFLPFLEPAFQLMFELLKEARECDTKMQVLYVLGFIIERMGVNIRPYAGSLTEYLPHLWIQSAEHHMLRAAILSTMVHLVHGLGTASSHLAHFLYSCIANSTDLEQPDHLYLLEDGLELWLAVLENTATPVEGTELLSLYRNMPALLEYGTENLRTCLLITQAYVLLCPIDFFKEYGGMVVEACSSLMTELRADGVVLVMRLTELSFKCIPTEAVHIFAKLMPLIVRSVMEGAEFPLVMGMYLSVLSRLILNAPASFSSLVGDDASLNRILTVWLEKLPLVTQPDRRKLQALALASLLQMHSSSILHNFCGILLGITEVLNDIIREDDMGSPVDSLLIVNGDDAENKLTSLDDDHDYEPETEHELRRKKLAYQDPVRRISLQEYAQSQLEHLRGEVGPQGWQELMDSVDVETMAQARSYFTL